MLRKFFKQSCRLFVTFFSVLLLSIAEGFVLSSPAFALPSSTLPKLQVSTNRRFLVKPGNEPFIWIGDTMWCWHTQNVTQGGCQGELTPAQHDVYLAKREQQRYTVIQTKIGYNSEVLAKDSAFWQEVDAWLQKIADHNMYAAVGLGWILNSWNQHPEYTEANLYDYGFWIGNRYKDFNNIIWLAANESTWPEGPLNKLNALLRGLRAGDTGDKLITVHPLSEGASSYFFTDLDFNSWQTARRAVPTELPDYNATSWNNGTYTVWEAITHDYNFSPPKPVIDLEAWYEGYIDELGGTGTTCSAWHTRSRAYYTIFAGAFGHTYGAHGLWNATSNATSSWRTALDYAGGDDMRHIRSLLESSTRSFLNIVPDQSLIVGGQGSANDYSAHKQSARAVDGSFAYVYSGNGSNFSVNTNALGGNGATLNAQWYNPRDGSSSTQNLSNPYSRTSSQPFDPPGSAAIDNDWVLILERSASPSAPANLHVK